MRRKRDRRKKRRKRARRREIEFTDVTQRTCPAWQAYTVIAVLAIHTVSVHTRIGSTFVDICKQELSVAAD